MIVKQHKDVDATDAKVIYGLSLKRLAALACGGFVITLGIIGLHLPPGVACLLGVATIFLMTYKRQGQIAPILLIRWLKSYKSIPYRRETIARYSFRNKKQQKKAAAAWNKELRRQRKKHPNAQVIKTVRCTRGKYSRK